MFDLSDEQRMLQDMLARLLGAAPADMWAVLAEQGIFAALFPEADGGLGGTGPDLAVVFEALGRATAPIPIIETVLLPGRLLASAGQDLAPLIEGHQRVALAHSEMAARYTLDWVETRAVGSRLSGTKSVVYGADTAQAFLVTARHSGAAGDQDGVGLYRVAADAPGLIQRAYQTADGMQAADLLLSETPADVLLEQAFPALDSAWAAATLAQGADCLGAMDAAAALTCEYLKTREQFGKPIGQFQALAHRLSDMMLAVEQARSAILMAAAAFDGPDRDRTVSAMKNLIGRMGRQVAEDAIQMHGGIGMTDDYALCGLAKRIVMADHRYGDTDHHLARFIQFGRAAI